MPYDARTFRSIKHGQTDANAYCRHCDWSEHNGNVASKARNHAQSKFHTVDLYRERHTEFTSYVKKSS